MLAYLTSLIRCQEKAKMDLSNASTCGIYEILLRVDAVTLVKSCTQVCRQWNEILGKRCFWTDKANQDGHPIPCKDLAPLNLNYNRLVVKRPFNRNLINDEWGSETFRMDKRWKFNGSGRGFEVERPPIFYAGKFVPGFNNSQVKCCLATSYFWSRKLLIIDLYESGLDPAILDELRPTIVVTELVSHRSDCSSTYEMACRLSRIPTHFLLPYREGDSSEEDENNSCTLRRTLQFDQWTDQSWTRVECRFKDYPSGMRYVIVETGGKDQQFWAGNYGSKMAHCSVTITTEFNRPKTAANASATAT